MAIQMKSKIDFWGKKGGSLMRDGTYGIKQQQWGCGKENIGPFAGAKRRRFYMERMGDQTFIAGIGRRYREGISPQKKFNKSHANAGK